MVLQSTKHDLKIFTMGEKLEEIVNKPPKAYEHPAMKDHLAYLNGEVRPNAEPDLRSTEAYPCLGRPPVVPEGGQLPPYPVVGPSQPQCGMRATDYTSDKFMGLSREMATYNYNRTTAIMYVCFGIDCSLRYATTETKPPC